MKLSLQSLAVFLATLTITCSAIGSHDRITTSSSSLHGSGSTPTSVDGNSTASVKASSITNGTCQSRTINYITHTLPQQCLRTDRSVTSSSSQPATESIQNGGSSSSVTSSELRSSTTTREAASSTLQNQKSETPPTTEIVAATTTTSTTTTTTTIASSVTPSTEPSPSDADADSPLDNANFLSFEEWKKQNLVKAGQSPENLAGRTQPLDANRPRPGINNALDTLGEESEIELDFSGFGGGASHEVREHPIDHNSRTTDKDTDAQGSPASQTLRSKDAGKTCKERTNYASFDCAAAAMKWNPECKSPSSVLVENKDSYMLNKCSAKNKFFIVELCNDILIDTVVLANYEFFSSSFRHFRISVSDRYPIKVEKWKDLGTFEARNTREIQAFLVENPLIWARYLRIEFLTHYGNEYYCPVSLLRVHGTTMMEEFRHQEELARGEGSDDDSAAEVEASAEPAIVIEETLEPILDRKALPDVEITAGDRVDHVVHTPETTTDATSDRTSTTVASQQGLMEETKTETSVPFEDTTPSSTSVVSTLTISSPGGSTSSPSSNGKVDTSSDSRSDASRNQKASLRGEYRERPSNTEVLQANSTMTSATSHTNTPGPSSVVPTNTTSSYISTATAGQNVTSSEKADPTSVITPTASQSTAVNRTASSDSTKSAASTASAPSAQPSTQESFFKSIHKRLQQLESNSTLSLQYIEEQSRILRDAFTKVEKRQITTTNTFLSHMNDTVMTELAGFRQAYDQLWQSTVLELEGQREQYQREMLVLSSRLSLVAEELVWQKRMGIMQSTLLLLCLGLVLFARTNVSGYLEVPLLQQMMPKSHASFRSGYDSDPNSPSPQSRSPGRGFRDRLWRKSFELVNSNITEGSERSRLGSRDGPEIQFSPPSPASLEEMQAPEEIEPLQEVEEDGEVDAGDLKLRSTSLSCLQELTGKASDWDEDREDTTNGFQYP